MRLKRDSVIVIFLMIVGVFSATLSIIPDNVGATILYVGGGGPGNYTTIQSALNAANVDDTVFVYNGTYREGIVIGRRLSLLGEDRNMTVIDGIGGLKAVQTTAGGVVLSGFTITNSTNYAIHLILNSNVVITDSNIVGNQGDGVALQQSTNCIVSNSNISNNDGAGVLIHGSANSVVNNNIHNNNVGILIDHSLANSVSGNNISGNGIGIILGDSNGGTISDNHIWDNGWGVYFYYSSQASMTNNMFQNDGILIKGQTFENWTHTIDVSNTVNGKPVYYWKSVNGGIIPQNAGQVILANCQNVVVENQNLTNGTAGIQLGFSHMNTISNNTITSNGYFGIQLYGSGTNIVERNNVSNNRYYGIDLDLSNGNVMANNTAHSTAWSGIHVFESDKNVLYNNTISNSSAGIHSTDSDFGLITNNSVFMNSWGGVIVQSSNDMIITGNSIDSNQDGISIWVSHSNTIHNNTVSSSTRYGIFLKSSSNNGIYHNRIQNNSQQAYDDTSANRWDNGYPSGGNYWSDYSGTDTKNGVNQDLPGSDGIGDSPYNIPGGLNQDRYPLMDPLSVLPTVPSEPQNLNATAGNQQVSLSWSPPASHGGSPITGYNVYRGNTSGGESFLAKVGNVLTYVDGGLINGQTYYYQVSAINIAGEGPNSTEANATPLIIPTVPSKPVNPLATPGDGFINLTWEAPLFEGNSSITNYRIYRGTTPGGEAFLQEIGNVTMHTDTGLTNGQTYYYQISAVNGIGEGPMSNEVYVTPTTVPGAPTSLGASLTGIGFKDVTITWSLSTDDGGGQNSVVEYIIYENMTYGPDGIGYQPTVSLSNGATSLTIVSAGEGDPNSYFYFVCAVDLNGLKNCTEEQAAKFTRHLSKGPNLVSIPLIQSDETIQAVLQSVTYNNAWSYDPINQEWKSFMKSKPYGQSLEHLNHTMAIWVNVTQDSNLTVAGVVPTSTTINLQGGWNLVGFPSFDSDYMVADLKAAIAVERIEGYDGSAPPYSLRVMSDGDLLQAGFGYWIRVGSETSWTIGNS